MAEKSIQMYANGEKIYPNPYAVGDLFITTNSENPSVRFGGTWKLFAPGRTLVCVDTSQTEFNTIGKTGGSKTHTLTVAQIPSHEHNIMTKALWGSPTPGNTGDFLARAPNNGANELKSGSEGYGARATGGGQAHNNLPPYITCYIWLRIS